MDKPAITEDDVRWMHGFLHLTTPYDAMPPLLRTAVVAAAAAMVPRLRRRAALPAVDFKRRAAGDTDD
jgi:hypothetical protein